MTQEREISRNEAWTIRRYGQQYGRNGVEIGGFVLTNGSVTFDENHSPSPQNSFCPDNWYKHPNRLAVWHTHPSLCGDYLSQADYEFSVWMSIPIIMYHPLSGNWDYYSPSGITQGIHLYPRGKDAGILHPSSNRSQKDVNAARRAIAEIEQAERLVYQAWQRYLKLLQQQKDRYQQAENIAVNQLNQLASQCQNSRAQSELANQAALVEIEALTRKYGGYK